MSASRVRSHLRKLRQQRNFASLSQEDKKQSISAVRNFVIFGGKRGNKDPGVAFKVFAKRFPLAKDKFAPVPRRVSLQHFIRQQIATMKAKLQRRKHNRLARKQRVRA